MSESNGFWSYVHADDVAEGDRISQLARDIVAQFEMLTGEPIKLFLDKDAIEWGQRWRDRIDESLSSVAFFIAVLTPRYFLSSECRRELNFFARAATNLGVKELVMPLLYIDVPAFRAEADGDELIELVKTFQWEDWRDLRFGERASEGYRRGVARLAQRLVEANRKAEEAPLGVPRAEKEREGPDETPGLIDRLAPIEETLPKLVETTNAIAADIETIGKDMTAATADIERADAQGKGLSGRLMVARRIAAKLSPIAERVWTKANEFATQLHEVDDAFRALIELAPSQIEADPTSRQTICQFFATVRMLNASAAKGLGAFQGMIDVIKPIESMSRDLRRPLRRLREGLTIVLEGREVIAEWVGMIDASGIECPSGAIDQPPEAS